MKTGVKTSEFRLIAVIVAAVTAVAIALIVTKQTEYIGQLVQLAWPLVAGSGAYSIGRSYVKGK